MSSAEAGVQAEPSPEAQFTQDAEHLATGVYKLWDTLWSMRVFTQDASNIKGFADKFARKSAHASCVKEALARRGAYLSHHAVVVVVVTVVVAVVVIILVSVINVVLDSLPHHYPLTHKRTKCCRCALVADTEPLFS